MLCEERGDCIDEAVNVIENLLVGYTVSEDVDGILEEIHLAGAASLAFHQDGFDSVHGILC